MKKYMIAIFAVLGATLLLGASGCEGNGNEGTNLVPFIGGAQQISVSFDQYGPPSETNVGDEFNVVLVLQNMGEYTIPQGDYFVRVEGLSPIDFGVQNVADLTVFPPEDLVGNEKNTDTGEIIESYPVYVEVPENYALSYGTSLAGNQQFTISADLCYQYKTTATGLLCVKKKLTKTQDSNTCVISGPQPLEVSGAPVRISNFQEYSGGSEKVRFSFAIEDGALGGFATVLGSECSDETGDQGTVFVTVDTGLEGLSCGFTGDGRIDESTRQGGYVRLSNGRRTISCSQDLTDQHEINYQKVIEITAEYDYQQTVQTSVLVKHFE